MLLLPLVLILRGCHLCGRTWSQVEISAVILEYLSWSVGFISIHEHMVRMQMCVRCPARPLRTSRPLSWPFMSFAHIFFEIYLVRIKIEFRMRLTNGSVSRGGLRFRKLNSKTRIESIMPRPSIAQQICFVRRQRVDVRIPMISYSYSF